MEYSVGLGHSEFPRFAGGVSRPAFDSQSSIGTWSHSRPSSACRSSIRAAHSRSTAAWVSSMLFPSSGQTIAPSVRAFAVILPHESHCARRST
mgnify:CR=1 FL=1